MLSMIDSNFYLFFIITIVANKAIVPIQSTTKITIVSDFSSMPIRMGKKDN